MPAPPVQENALPLPEGPAAGDLLLGSVLDRLPVGVLIFQASPLGEAVCHSANATFERWSKAGRNELVGLPLPRMRFLSESVRLNAAVERALHDPDAPQVETDWSVPELPRPRHFSAHISVLPAAAESARRVVVAVRDRTPEIQAENHLRQTMLSDTLTGMANRTMFTELVEAAIEAGEDVHCAVIIVNIDRFKRVNESLGHVVGDELLIAMARRLLPRVRGNDRIARLAGDEFAILLHDIEDEDDTRHVVARVRDALAAPFSLSGGELFVSASIGIATTFSSERYAEDLIRDADFAMHQAKARGIGGEQLYRARDHSVARDLFKLESELRRAIGTDALELHYQPLVDLQTGRLTGVEALARWRHPERGMVSPADFIPLAEDSGLIVPLGRWALQTACRQMRAWRDAVPSAANLKIAVNLSGVQLAQDDIVAAVSDALQEAGLPGAALKLELTESAVVGNPDRAKAIFTRLKALDALIVMDDFGTGYSSLSYLQQLPIDILKIDQSFVGGMLESEDSRKIVDAIMSLANALGMETIAEGVETAEQAAWMQKVGCTTGQGYYYSRPVPADEIEALLRKDAVGVVA